MEWFRWELKPLSKLDTDMNCEYLIEKFSSHEAKERHAVPYIDSGY